MARNVMFKFNLLCFPAKLEKATESPIEMANLCVGQPDKAPHDALPVKKPTTCTTCGPITDVTALKKGIKCGNTFSLVDREALTEAKATYSTQYKGVLDFVPHPAEEVFAQTAPGESLNYLMPADSSGENHYQLMLKLVREHPELAFVSLHTPVSATNLYVLAVRGEALVVEQRVRGQQLRAAPSVGGAANEQLYQMLDMTIGGFVTPFNADAYEDGYAAAVARMAEEGEQVTVGDTKAAPTATVISDEDLMTKLQALAGGKTEKKPAKKAAKKMKETAA